MILWFHRAIEKSPKMWEKKKVSDTSMGLSENTGPKSRGFSSFSMLKWPQNGVFQVWRWQGLPVAVAFLVIYKCPEYSKYFAFLIPSILMSPQTNKTHNLGRVSVLIGWGRCFRWWFPGLTPIQQPFTIHQHPGRQSWRRPETTSSRRAASPASAAHGCAAATVTSLRGDHPYRSVTEYTSLLINTLLRLIQHVILYVVS